MNRLIIILIASIASVAYAQLAPNAPKDQPFRTTSSETESLEKRIAPLIEEARRTYPDARDRFLQGLPPRHTFFITTRLVDTAGRFEQVFIHVDSIDGSTITGTIANQIQVVSGYAEGNRYVFEDTKVMDWLISKPDGSEEGNLIGKFMDEYQNQR